MPKYDFFDPNPYGVHMKALDTIGSNKKVLEVGCSTGQISRRLAENGCEVTGIEIDEDSARDAMKYCEKIFIKDVETIGDLPYYGYFDFITFLDVLEHLKSPLNVLKKFKNYLKEEGYIIVSLPNIANWHVRYDLLRGSFDYEERGILDRTHLRFFNEKSAKGLLECANFEILKFDIIPTLPLLHLRAKFEYAIGKLKPNLFASQFLIIGRVKKQKDLL